MCQETCATRDSVGAFLLSALRRVVASVASTSCACSAILQGCVQLLVAFPQATATGKYRSFRLGAACLGQQVLHSASVRYGTGGGDLTHCHFVSVVFAHWCSLLAQSGAEPLINYLYLFPTCWSWGNRCILRSACSFCVSSATTVLRTTAEVFCCRTAAKPKEVLLCTL